MGQGDILQILKKSKNRWLSSEDIANKQGIGIRSTRVVLKKLREAKEINFIKKSYSYLYKYGGSQSE